MVDHLQLAGQDRPLKGGRHQSKLGQAMIMR